MSNLNKLKNALGIGARANRYQVLINSTGKHFAFGEEADLLCKSTTIPGRSFADIEVWHKGRLTTIAGDAQYDGTWSCTFLDTEDHTLRKRFIDWMEYIDSVNKHSRTTPDNDSYMSSAVLHQLSTINNNVTSTYKFYDIYPKSISDSSLSDDSSELIEFTIEFNYSSWELL
jgi:hypothetical protein